MLLVFTSGALLFTTLNVVVSVLVARAPVYTKSQKTAQIFGIWLVPIAGVLVAWLFLKENDPGPFANPHPDTDDLKTIGIDPPNSLGHHD